MKKFLTTLLVLCSFLFSNQTKEPLSLDEAFKIESKIVDKTLMVDIVLGEKIYLYADKLKISITKPIKIDITNEFTLPLATKYNEHLIYDSKLNLKLHISKIKEKIGSENFSLQIHLQGCSKIGICYSPLKKSFDFGEKIGNKIEKENSDSLVKSQQNLLADVLRDSNIFVILFTFFLGGLALSLTPCVFPMIPILSSIIASQSDEKMDTKKGFILSLIYVLAMSITYTIAGVVAGVFGSNIQAAFQTPWVIFSFSAIFIALAFSMFGYFDIEMPKSIQTKISKKSEEAGGHGVVGIAIMGFLSALIVGPCVAAPLAGALIYIGQTGDALLGGVALFVLSIGMGVPLLIIGAGAGKYMPKPGGWMENVKAIFAVVLLGVAIWMLSRIIDDSIIMFLWSLLLLSSAIYMGVFEPFKQGVSGVFKFIKVIALIFLLYGGSLFIGALSGATNPIKPFEKFTSKGAFLKENKLNFEYVKSINELNEKIQKSQKAVMVDFYASWCVSCKELEEITFKDEDIINELKNFTLIKVDLTKQTKDDKELMQRFEIIGPPALIFYKNQKELKNLQIVGYKNPKEFFEHLKRVESYKKTAKTITSWGN